MEQSTEENKKDVEAMSSDEMIATIEKMQIELENYDKETDEICKRQGMTRREMKEYVENKNNFSAEEWKQVAKARGEVEKFRKELWEALGKDVPEPPSIDAESKNPEKKKKKRPFSGMNKKGWIPMS